MQNYVRKKEQQERRQTDLRQGLQLYKYVCQRNNSMLLFLYFEIIVFVLEIVVLIDLLMKGTENTRKLLRSLSRFWGWNRNRPKLQWRATMSLVAILSSIRYFNYIYIFIFFINLFYNYELTSFDLSKLQAGISALEDALDNGFEDFKVIKKKQIIR